MRDTCSYCGRGLRVNPVELERIVNIVADAGRVNPERIYGGRRDKQSAFLRQVVMYAAHKAGFSYPEIGAVLGRHHTTCMHGARQIEEKCADREDIRDVVALALESVATVRA